MTSSIPCYKNDGQVPFVWEQALTWKKTCPEDQIFIIAPHHISAKIEEEIEGIHIFRFVYWFPKRWQKLAYPAILPNIRKNPLLIFQVPLFLLSELLLTIKVVKQFKITLVFAHWVMPQGFIAFIVERLYKIPYGLKNYSSDIRIFHKFSFLGRWLARKIIKNAKVMFCENSRLKTEALELFSQKNRPNIKSKIIPLCMGVFDPMDKSDARDSQCFPYDFGFIGRLTKKKGIHTFIKALTDLKNQGNTFNVIIAGDGEEGKYLRKLATGLNIEFAGFVSDEKKQNFFDKSKFCVFPSCATKDDVEGLPVALLEALYFGKIVIASKATNIELLPEWNDIREAVYLLDTPGNIKTFATTLHKVAKLDKKTINAKAQKARNIMKRYRWDNLIHEYIKVLK